MKDCARSAPRRHGGGRNRLLLNIWQSLQIETRTTITMLVDGGDPEKAAQVAREHQDYFERLPVPVRGGQK